MQSYWEITSDAYLDFIKDYVVGIGPWKDTVVPVVNNYLQTPTDLVSRAHAHDLQVDFFPENTCSCLDYMKYECFRSMDVIIGHNKVLCVFLCFVFFNSDAGAPIYIPK